MHVVVVFRATGFDQMRFVGVDLGRRSSSTSPTDDLHSAFSVKLFGRPF
jgi:hypothetical protein